MTHMTVVRINEPAEATIPTMSKSYTSVIVSEKTQKNHCKV